MSDQPASPNSSANEIKLLRDATGMPWLMCKEFLDSMSAAAREEYLAIVETQRGEKFYHDPIEDDPTVRSLFLAACEEAEREVKAWHERSIAELEIQSPEVAGIFRSGRGLCHRIWAKVKTILKDRHNIDWRSPAEMNRWTHFD